MLDPSEPYKSLLDLYLGGELTTEEFREQYSGAYLSDDTMFEPALYEILNEIFTDVESVTSDPELLAEGPAIHLDEKQFREKAELASTRLAHWRGGRGASG